MKNPLKFSIKFVYSALGLALLLGLVFFSVQNSRAGTVIVVNSTEDIARNDNQCTLREAVIAANKDQPSGSKQYECPAGSGADTILLPNDLPGGSTFVLTRTDNGNENSSSTGDLDMLDDVIIVADGPGVTIVGEELSFSDRVIHVLSGNVTIQGLTIKGGVVKGSGGGIRNEAQLTLSGVTISGNTADGDGGGISNASGAVLTMVNSTLSGNSATGSGGGISNRGTATLNNVTISENKADSNADGTGDGGGIARQAGTLTLKNTIVAGNLDSSPTVKALDCSGTLTSGGYNLIQDASTCTVSGDTTGNLTGVDPLLGALADNGGNTFTYELGDGSPAIDAGNPAVPGSGGNACEQTDQRGTYRPHGEACDIGSVESGGPDASVIVRAFSDDAAETTTAVGRLTGAPNTTFTLYFYTSTDPNDVCFTTSSGGTLVGQVQVTTDSDGDVIFSESFQYAVPHGEFIVASTIDPSGFSSDYSQCVRVGAGNDSWPYALELPLVPNPQNPSLLEASIDQYLDLIDASRWFSFTVQPYSKVVVTLSNLPDNYDLTVYKDIQKAFDEFSSLDSDEDLKLLGAEFATDAFSTDAFSTDAFSTDAFSTDAFSTDAFSTDAFSALVFSTDAFSTDAFSTDAFSTDAFSTDAFSTDAFSTDAFSTDAFSTDAFSTDAFSTDAFSSAQTRSLIAISAFNGTAGEGVIVNTWDSDTKFFVRVRGRNGVFNPFESFHLEVKQFTSICNGVNSQNLPASDLVAQAGGYNTIILTSLGRMAGTQLELTDLSARLNTLAARPEVNGVIVDVSQDARVAEAYNQSDNNPDCPAAQNNLAASIKGLVDKYWEVNPLQYVVIVGGDDVIPFFRHPDHALLANEQNYRPPVKNGTISQSSLRYGNVLSQDDYGARLNFSLKDDEFPIPELAVGRLLETALEATTMLDAYLQLGDGDPATPDEGMVVPSSSLVTGYDFLEDTALAVQSELEAGIGAGSDTLITPRDVAPTDPVAWTADDLRSELFGERHDLIFLAGHFSGNSALAADFTTRILAEELAQPDPNVDLTNVILFSAGCHVGYNIVDPHGVPLLTRQPDWGQAAARRGLTLIGGTGYQYGDTDFIMYSEQLYREFSRQLRVGTGPVSIGQALVKAKHAYLANNPFLRGIDEKALLEATLFGLPMLSVDMPGQRLSEAGEPSIVSSTSGYNTNPGATLGLEYADVSISTPTIPHTVDLDNIEDPALTSTATFFSGDDGIFVKPNEPTLPLKIENVSVANTVLRGVGFRGGTYTDLLDLLPFTGAAATEIRGVHTPFLTSVWYPSTQYNTNYFDALADPLEGVTNLFLYPAQFMSNPPSSPSPQLGTWRTFQAMDLRLFYSANTTTYNPDLSNESTPAQSAAPSISVIATEVGSDHVNFRMHVVGNPAVGIQEVWVTYTGMSGSLYGSWQSIDLTQSLDNSTLWEGTLMLPAGVSADQIRYIVQAVNGVGLVSKLTNQGYFYTPGEEAGPTTPTSLELVDPVPSSGRFTTQVTLHALLTSNGTPLANQAVILALGPQSRLGITDANGIATATLWNYALPGETRIRASYAGEGDFQAAHDESLFISEKQLTEISLVIQDGFPEDASVLATLTDVDGHTLFDDTLIFYVSGPGGIYGEVLATDYAGRAKLENIPLGNGSYIIEVYFSGEVTPYQLSLSDTRYEPAFASGTINLLNHVPVAVDDAYSVDEDGVLNVAAPGVLGNDSDPDGHPLSAVLVSGPSHGLLSLNADGSFAYTPDSNFNGSDSFTYAADDGFDSVSAVVNITVNPVNDAPVAVDDAYNVDEDGVLNVTATGVLGNDSDIDGDGLTASLVSDVTKGTLIFNSDGSFSYDPNGQYEYLAVGETAQDGFTYTASDGNGGSATATVTITIDGVNDAPVAVDDAYSTYENIVLNEVAPGVLSNDTDLDGDPRVVSAVNGDSANVGQQITLTTGALLTVNADGSFSYDPNSQFDTLAQGEVAGDSFTYTISDGNGGSDTAMVNITIDGVNDPPFCSTVVADVDSLWPPNGNFYTVTLSGATDPNGDMVILTIYAVFQDELVGSEADAILYYDVDPPLLSNQVKLRAERDGSGDGRVYHVLYDVDDGLGGICSGDLHLGVVEHDRSGDIPVDSEHEYDSTVPTP